jgi:tRNA modification GTPase
VLPKSDNIAAVATAPGRGGIGIVRISGRELGSIATSILGKIPTPRKVAYASFKDEDN